MHHEIEQQSPRARWDQARRDGIAAIAITLLSAVLVLAAILHFVE